MRKANGMHVTCPCLDSDVLLLRHLLWAFSFALHSKITYDTTTVSNRGATRAQIGALMMHPSHF